MTPILQRLIRTQSPPATLLIRVMVGGVFLSEGIQKFLFPGEIGAGRFAKIGLPSPEVLGPFVGATEIYYSITNVAALRLPASGRRYPAWVAWSGLATCLLMAFSLQLQTILSGVALLLAGFLFRLVLTKVRSQS